MRWYDISPPLSERTAPWPGDRPFRRTRSMAFERGDHLELSSIETTLHIGAHADGPIHYSPSGVGIGERSLDRYLGPCELRTVAAVRHRRVDVATFGPPPLARRVLLRTGTYPDPQEFTTDFASLGPELVEWLADHGAVLIGLDTPSVDPFDDTQLHAHQAVARRDLAILEGLVFDGVPDGCYLLVAAPLRISGADAAPVRAALGGGLSAATLAELESTPPLGVLP